MNKFHCFKKFSSALLFGALLVSNSLAEVPKESPWDIKVGALAIAGSTPWQGSNTEFLAVPYLKINYGNWYFGAQGAGYELDITDYFGISMGVKYRDDGYDKDWSDHRVFRGYDSPDGEVLLNYAMTFGWFRVDANHDISNESEADSVSLTLEIPIYQQDQGVQIAFTGAAHWYNSDYVNYYYGIDGTQANSSIGRFLYHADSAINYEIGIKAIYPLTDNWTLFGRFSHTKVDNSIVDSPLIEFEDYDTVALGLVYQF